MRRGYLNGTVSASRSVSRIPQQYCLLASRQVRTEEGTSTTQYHSLTTGEMGTSQYHSLTTGEEGLEDIPQPHGLTVTASRQVRRVPHTSHLTASHVRRLPQPHSLSLTASASQPQPHSLNLTASQHQPHSLRTGEEGFDGIPQCHNLEAGEEGLEAIPHDRRGGTIQEIPVCRGFTSLSSLLVSDS